MADAGTISDKGESVLKLICGARLTSVDFVLDYLILGFDAKGVLTTLVWPELIIGGKQWRFGATGYRDLLCGLITAVVTDVRVTPEGTILISFANDSQLRIALRDYKAPGERAIFNNPQRQLCVW